MTLSSYLKGAALVLGALVAGSFAIAQAQAQAYPEREIRVIVPFSAGGGTDLVTRLFAQELSERLGKPFFVENLAAGAGGAIGSTELSRAEPDGYTIGSGTSSGIVNVAMDSGNFNPLNDLAPIARYGATTLVLAANPAFPADSLEALVAYAKANPNATYGSSGVGSTTHLAFEMLASQTGIKLTHVPYRGEGAGITDLIAGQIQLMLLSLPAARQHVESGALRALAVTSSERFPALPNVPTLVELGLDGFVVDAWYGMYVPKGMPAEITDVLVKHVNEIRNDPEVSGKLLNQLSFSTAGTDDPESFKAYMEDELKRYTDAATAAGARK